jgi:hypothetical protein
MEIEIMSLKNLLRFLLLISLVLTQGCKQSDSPTSDEVAKALFGPDSDKTVKILGTKVINLDEEADLESIVLSRSGQSESISVYKKLEGNWKFQWKQEFNLLSLGDMYYDLSKKSWIPGVIQGKEKKVLEGDCIRRIVLADMPGDNFNSVFVEVLSEEPPLGLFSIPFGYRKGKKILDGLQLKEHEELVRTKRLDFEYSQKDKSIRIFPTSPNYSQEFVFNGWEMIPNLPMQPVPAFVSMEIVPKLEVGKESKITIQFKNRGNFASVTYLSLNFPDEGNVRMSETSQGVRIYNKGQTVYNIIERRQIPAQHTLLEATKEGWGTNFKYGISFYYTPIKADNTFILFRSSFKYYKEIVSIPNRESISKIQIDQQGFATYPLEIKIDER